MKPVNITLTVISAMLASASVYAHDLWIMPETNSNTINASIGYGHNFPQQGSETGKRDLLVAPELRDSANKYPLEATDNDYVFISHTSKKAGHYILSTEMKPAYWSKTDNGWKSEDRLSGENISYCMRSTKYAKTLFTIDSPANKNPGWIKTSTQQALEIIPQTDPLTLKTSELVFQVTYNGQPLPDKEVRLDSEAYTQRAVEEAHGGHPHPDPEYKAVTDQQGMVKFSQTGAGKWMLVVANKLPYPEKNKCDEDVYKATLTFNRQ